MAKMQAREGRGTGTELTGREIRRLVDLILSSDVQRRKITPLSRMIPGFSREDAQLVRDEVVRRRVAKGDRSVVLLGRRHGLEPVIVSERLVSATTAHVPVGPSSFLVRGVAGLRVKAEWILDALQGEDLPPNAGDLVLGLEVARYPFGPAEPVDADLIAVNGGVSRLVFASPHTLPQVVEGFRILRDGEALVTGLLPSKDEIRVESMDTALRAIRGCAPLAELFEAETADLPDPEIVFSIGLGEPIDLAAECAVELEVAGVRLASVIADSDHFM